MFGPDRDPRTPASAANTAAVESGVDETAGAVPGDTSAAPAFGPPSVPGEVGTLGPYRVVKQLGRGGMGAVYLAVDTRLNRSLALKVMLPRYAANPAARERFLREARAAAQITHDNVVTVYEADERDGVPYIAMQFLQGYALDEYLRRKGNPTVPQVLRVAGETAAGLAAAHRIGLVHRDVKPGNLWLEAPDGRVKVLDFGLAKPVDAAVELTRSGAVVGTPAYMSPEQAGGKKVDARTDLFSLGAVLYRLCTGKLPFEGDTTMAVLMALGTEEPTPVRELNPDVPEPLAELVHQLLAKNPDARPQSADEVVRRVRSIVDGLTTPTAQTAGTVPSVVYVPIQVTSPPSENSAFANLTESEAPPPDAVPAEKPVRRKPSGWGMWVAAGLASVLAAAVLGGVIIIIKNKDGSVTKIVVPDDAEVEVQGKDGKTIAKVVPGNGAKPAPAADNSPDRKAAEWVLSIGGKVGLDDQERTYSRVDELPKELFRLTRLGLDNNKRVTDEGLANLKGCKNLKHLEIFNTEVTDQGFAHFKDCETFTTLFLLNTDLTDTGLGYFKKCKNIETLDLKSTKVTDDGLAQLESQAGLKSLWLNNTKVTDTGLALLKKCKSLTCLDLKGTKVTAKGVADFQAAVPGCKVEFTGGALDPIDVDRKAAERVLALGGSVRVKGQPRDTTAAADLPAGPITLTRISLFNTKAKDDDLAFLKHCREVANVNLDSAKELTGSGLAHLADCVGLKSLSLSQTAVGDDGLAHLKGCKNLEILALQLLPNVSDEGVAHLKDCGQLKQLILRGTPLTDAGLRQLMGLKNLTNLDVRQTKVTAKGVSDFRAAVPGCKVEHGGEVIDPKK